MWIVLAVLTAPWRLARLYSSKWGWILAILLFAMGFWLYSQSGKHFSAKQLGGIPELVPAHHEQHLVTTGIRARVRHPVYLAHLCEMLAWSLGTGLIVCFGLTAIAVLTGSIMIRMEDAELSRRFGPPYEEYKQNVPALLPRLGRRS